MKCKHVECEAIFNQFIFENIKTISPPNELGVYTIRINKAGEPVDCILKNTKQIIEKLEWNLVTVYMEKRINRISRIEECPYIYIGKAGGENKHNGQKGLYFRFQKFKNNHTAMMPLWVLLYFGWDLEYGYYICNDPQNIENELKISYKGIHGVLPALVDQ